MVLIKLEGPVPFSQVLFFFTTSSHGYYILDTGCQLFFETVVARVLALLLQTLKCW